MSKQKKQNKGLGKGLGAFFSEDFSTIEEEMEETEEKALEDKEADKDKKEEKKTASSEKEEKEGKEEDASTSPSTEGEQVQEIPIDQIRPNPYQPRMHFDETALQELADSIKEQGVLQPIIVRKSAVKGYELIAGERRVRASKMAGNKTIPAIVRQMDDSEMIETSIIENLQREDLSPLEEAEAYKSMMDNLNLTQAETAKRLGKSRSHVANMVRLLDLNDDVKELLQDGKLSTGQARTLLGVKNKKEQSRLAKKTVDEGLTVRQLEKIVQALNEPATPVDKPEKKQKPTYVRETEDRLMDKFGTNVKIKSKGDHGKIEIEYLSEEDLTRILDILDIRFED